MNSVKYQSESQNKQSDINVEMMPLKLELMTHLHTKTLEPLSRLLCEVTSIIHR